MRLTMSVLRRRQGAIATMLLVCLILWPARSVYAHNALVHESMARRAYQIMQLVDRMSRSHQLLGAAPQGVSTAQWNAFQTDVSAAHKRMNSLGGELNPGDLSSTATADKLANAASAPDYNLDDTHLFVKVTNMAGTGAVNKIMDEAAKAGVASLLIPVVCIASCFASLFGFGGDTCKECVKNAENLADKTPTPDDLENLVPGIGDITSSQFTGLWHFINMSNSPLIENTYDDHQGMLYEVAGPNGMPGAIDIGIMASTDLAGLSVNPDKSDGVKRFQIPGPNDSFPDGDTYNGSVERSSAQWQNYPMGHTPFCPVDNLALYGWQQFRDQGRDLTNLGFPLHALGDATVPMHVMGTTSWGHRPYEDAQEQLWSSGQIPNGLSNERILQAAFRYRQEIVQWRAAGHTNDIPIRHLVRAVARHTFDYSQKQQTQTASTWPFNDASSVMYYPDSEGAISLYRDRPDAVALVVPLLEDGIAAQLAILMSAAEVNGIAQNPGTHISLTAYRPQNRTLPKNPGLNKFIPPAVLIALSPLERAARQEYGRLALLLITNKMTPAEYLFRVRSLTRKVRAAGARGDESGKGIADEPPIPAGTRLPQAPSARVMGDVFSSMRMMLTPKCASQPAPTTPRLQKIGYGYNDRDLAFAVWPVNGAKPNCPIFYEFAVELTDEFPGAIPLGAAPRAFKRVVFRNTDSADLNPTGKGGRLVFRIRSNEPRTGERGYLLAHADQYKTRSWRVRAVNANGLSSDWSAWQKDTGFCDFGEP